MNALLLRDVEVDGARVDVRVVDGRIAAVDVGLDAADDEGRAVAVIDGAGGALIPGLHDHHVHVLAIAARRRGVDVDALATPAEFDAAVANAARAADGDWVRVAGHDEHRHGPLDRDRLDAIAPGARVRVQHRSGLAWTMSSAALAAVDPATAPDGAIELDDRGRPSGRVLRADDWLAVRIGAEAPSLTGLGCELAALGLTGITDATPSLGAGRLEALRRAVDAGDLPQRLVLLGADATEVDGWAAIGPAKLLADEVRGLDPDALATTIGAHHADGRPVAIHAVSRSETVTAVTALALAGPIPGDRIEHGSVLPRDLDAVLAAGGVTVVAQPSLPFERGDHHLATVADEDLPFLHRLASLRAAGIPLAAGSDAPVTSIDPWVAIRAAVERLTRSGVPIGDTEALDPAAALDLFLGDPLAPGGPPRRVRRGAPADLVLLDAPLALVLASPDRSHVRSTWVGGRLVHG